MIFNRHTTLYKHACAYIISIINQWTSQLQKAINRPLTFDFAHTPIVFQ